MTQKTVLVPVYETTPIADLKPYFEIASEDNLHVNFQVVAIAPPAPYYTYGYPPYGSVVIPDDWQDSIQQIAQMADDKVTEIENESSHIGVSADVTRSLCENPTVNHVISGLALVSDIAILPNFLRGNEDIYPKILSGVLYESPVAAIINPDALERILHPKRIFVAWNGGIHSAKAVMHALPLIKKDTEVHIGWFDPVMNQNLGGEDPGTDIAAKLSRHGCKVTLHQCSSGGREIADGIRRKATELGADLIVMGAYGHSKLRERVFGGTTQSMLEQTQQAVLLAH